MRTVILLVASNLFMTTAWYGHLRYKGAPLMVAILASWLIALPEYALQVPANRLGHGLGPGQFSAPQLKIIQEVVSLTVFAGFSALYLGEPLRWREVLAFGLIAAGVAVAFYGRA